MIKFFLSSIVDAGTDKKKLACRKPQEKLLPTSGCGDLPMFTNNPMKKLEGHLKSTLP